MKFTVETVGQLRTALRCIKDDVPIEVVCDGATYRKFKVQSLHDGEPECFVQFEAVDIVA